ncbi:hypothetical protein MASR2M78_09070 [Treponema sp.]
MKQNLLGIVGIAAIIAVLAACTSVPPSQNEKRVEQLVVELNSADIDRIMELSALPFLLDGETVAREQDLRMLWTNLKAAGFSFADASIAEIREIGPSSYKSFSEDPEVLAFFKKHSAKGAALVELSTRYGKVYILTGSKVGRIPKIYGFKAPEAQ